MVAFLFLQTSEIPVDANLFATYTSSLVQFTVVVVQVSICPTHCLVFFLAL